MTRCYLFGPVEPAYAERYLQKQRASGACLTFNAEGTADVAIGPGDTWTTIQGRLPTGWQPDFIALYLPYTTIPTCLWSAPVPLVGLAADWNLLWHWYRRCLRSVELVLTDTVGVETLACEGITHARAATLYGCPSEWVEKPWPERERDLDALFVGNLSPYVQRERLAWLGRLARLGDRYRVSIRTGVFGDDYRELLARARIVFNHSIRGECNQRVFEAVPAGALLFQEEGNREVPRSFADRQECVYFNADNLEELLEYYLEHEEERAAIANAARAKMPGYTFSVLWQEQLALIDADWEMLQERARQRPAFGGRADLLARTWQAVSCAGTVEPGLEAELAAAVVADPRQASLQHALALVRQRGATAKRDPQSAMGYFRRTLEHEPRHLVAHANLVQALLDEQQNDAARAEGQRALTALGELTRLPSEVCDSAPYPPSYDVFRVEWERAAWQHAGDPGAEAQAKLALLRWRLYSLLAQAKDELTPCYEAVLARPDLPSTRAQLGAALARRGQPREAAAALRQALTALPFDRESAATLSQLVDESGRRRLAWERRLLARVAPEAVRPERWFMEAPPVGDECASIIILCCNQLEYTRQCLESVVRHTRSPYELILVDNGSTDGTADYLRQLQTPSPHVANGCASSPSPLVGEGRGGGWGPLAGESTPHPSPPPQGGREQMDGPPPQGGRERVVVIRNETNRGFPAGCNQGLAAARGDYIVFLNNDTVVTPSWLDGLVAWALHDWPHIGMVGPVTNYSRPPQQITTDYTGLEGLDEFAARRQRQFAHKAITVDRLTGFCLLARRDVLQQIGGFDERYGNGFFDDDDLSLRAKQAGFQLYVALNVFIHHFGSRTFTALGIDCAQQLQANFEQFRAKWGEQHAAGYRMPGEEGVRDEGIGAREQATEQTGNDGIFCSPLSPIPSPLPVSLCIIVKNEEANLPSCLASASGLVNEIIVVDTGSTDRTREIAAGFGARVADFPWCDDFAAARNEALRHATGDWIFWLDADDRVDEANQGKLKEVFASLKDENVAYVMKCMCLPDARTGSSTVVDHVRLFRNRPEIRWKYRVHEQILPAVRATGGTVRWADVVIQHTGYQDPALRRRKLERDIRLLNLENADHPDDPFTLFNLGSIYQELGRQAEAIPALRRSLEKSAISDSIVRKLFALLTQCHRQLGQKEEALTVCRKGRQHYPEDAELLFLEGLILREQGDAAGAEAAWVHLLHGHEGDHFASVDAGLRGYKTRHNLAVLYQEQGRLAEAEAHWRTVLAQQPTFVATWIGLGELLLKQERWSDLEAIQSGLHAHGYASEATVFRARAHLAQREFPAARQLLEECVAHALQAVWPRVILTHVLLQGQDWPAAEQALRDVLRLDPQHPEARRNLETLLRQQGRADVA